MYTPTQKAFNITPFYENIVAYIPNVVNYTVRQTQAGCTRWDRGNFINPLYLTFMDVSGPLTLGLRPFTL